MGHTSHDLPILRHPNEFQQWVTTAAAQNLKPGQATRFAITSASETLRSSRSATPVVRASLAPYTTVGRAEFVIRLAERAGGALPARNDTD